jgi:hypothetical protein
MQRYDRVAHATAGVVNKFIHSKKIEFEMGGKFGIANR